MRRTSRCSIKSAEPVDVAGVLLSTDDEAQRAIEAQFRGVGPWSAKGDYTAVEGLERAIDAAGRFLPVFSRAVAGHLEDDDITRRTLAVAVADRVAKSIGSHFISLALQLSPELFKGVKPVGHPTNQPDLRWSLLVALGKAVTADDADGIRVLREAAKEERGFWLTDALARIDLDWLLENAGTVVPKKGLGGALKAMPNTESRVALVKAMGPWTNSEQETALAGSFWGSLPDAAPVRAAIESA